MLTARIAVLVSGGGTNLQALLDARDRGELPHGSLALVIADRRASGPSTGPGRGAWPAPSSPGGSRALRRRSSRPCAVNRSTWWCWRDSWGSCPGTSSRPSPAPSSISTPSLIPSFCGKGFYGLRVHQAALDYGVKVTGATVHYVNEVPDGGKILLQKAVEILPGDTAEVLQRRVMEQAEWVILPQAAELVAQELAEHGACPAPEG